MTNGPGHLFCFGFGYTAQRLALALRRGGWTLSGTHRQPEAAAALRDAGLGRGLPFRADCPLPPDGLEGVTHVLISIPPDEEGDPVLRHHGADLVRVAPRWVGLLSTTGVYGDTGGAWVDEGTPPRPTQPRSRRRLEAETAWLDLWRKTGLPVHVFRLAGIYGPGRSAFDQLRAGTAQRIIKPDHLFSRIHVDDIAQVLMASMAAPDPGAIYNVCDEDPSPPAEVIATAAALLGVPAPPDIPFEAAQALLSPMALSFWADNRRVRADRLWEDLGVTLHYPTVHQGLEAILDEEQGRRPPGPPATAPRGCG